MESSKLLETLRSSGLEINNLLETENSGLIISASKTYNIILGKRKVGCIVEFEFSTDSKTVINNLTRKITDIKPIIHQLSEQDIVDLKSNVIKALQSEPAIDITKFKITNDKHKIKEGDVFFEDGGLGLANYETLLIINFMKRIEQRLMMKIEEMFDQNRQSAKGNDIEVETEKLLDIQGVSELLGLAKATIYSKLSRNELPYMKRGKKVYFKEKEILEYLNRGKVLSNDELEELARKKLKGK
jgi:excisionase family DNA binding protein